MVAWLTLLMNSGAMACLSSGSAQDEQGYVAPGAADWEVLAKAQPDECFYGVGSTSNQYPIAGACSGTFKRNAGYIWGMTKFGDNIFFGTGSNVACLVAENYFLVDGAIEDPDYVCEETGSAYPFHDLRTSELYVYSKKDGLRQLAIPAEAEPLRQAAVGIRAGGVHPSGIVFLAGPIAKQQGIVMFAFAGQTGDYLGAARLDIGSNIRSFLTTSSGTLYAGVGGTEDGVGTGSVHRWTGDSEAVYNGDTSSLFSFEKVGANLDGEAAQLCEHEGRIFITTWPDHKDPQSYAGLWMSPPLPLTSAGASGWKKLWSAGQYDPYPLAAKRYGGGALASYGGYLYWGTMHVPGMNYYHFTDEGENQPRHQRDKIKLANNVNRAFSLFRGSFFETSRPRIELLYGGTDGGKFKVPSRLGFFHEKRNLMGLQPLYGDGGINNIYNNYCWSMTIFKNHLYVGTMDYAPLSQGFLLQYPPNATFGFDLFRFDSARRSAVRITSNGMGNENQYGIRTMVADSDTLYIGTAGNSNILPGGGWELIGMKETTFADSFVYCGPYRMEAEKMSLTSLYADDDESASEDRLVYTTSGLSRASFRHTGHSGSYDIAIRYFDPGSGSSQSNMNFYVGGQSVAQNPLNKSRGWYMWHIDGVNVDNNDTLSIETTMDRSYRNSYFQMDFIDLVSPDAEKPPTPDPDPDPDPDPEIMPYGGDGNNLDLSLLEPGDIIMMAGVVSDTTIPGGSYTHSALYVGDNQIVEAWSPAVRRISAESVLTASSAAIYRVNAVSGGTSSSAENIALQATASTSYVSPWETLDAVNDGYTPADSNDKSHGAYGNWNYPNSYQWVRYDWQEPRTVTGVEIYWFDDGGGVLTPTAAYLEYWDGTTWVNLGNVPLEKNTFNQVAVDNLNLQRLRVTMRNSRQSTGILEFRVWGGGTIQAEDSKQAAIAFAVDQIGKPYDWSFLDKGSDGKDLDSSEWYCSELVWAAYKQQGIELDSQPENVAPYFGHVAPMEVIGTSNVTLITSSE